ncbi:MAG: hypothetical protein ACYT04_79075, partial [Nostoc sp.]
MDIDSIPTCYIEGCYQKYFSTYLLIDVFTKHITHNNYHTQKRLEMSVIEVSWKDDYITTNGVKLHYVTQGEG